MRHLTTTLALAASLSACAPAPEPASVDADALARRASASTAPPCADGGWGDIDAPESAVHVRTSGSDSRGDGSLERPFRTVDAALDAELRKLALQGSGGSGGTCRTLDFDRAPSGAAIPAGADASELYAAWGVHIETRHTNDQLAGLGVTDRHGHGNGLIRAQNTRDHDRDGLIDDPSPHNAGAVFYFRFDAPSCVQDLELKDLDRPRDARVSLLGAAGEVLDEQRPTGHDDDARVSFNACGVHAVRVAISGQGRVDDLSVCDGGGEPDAAPIRIAVGPGRFPTRLRLEDSISESPLDVAIEGCSASETRLVARSSRSAVARVSGHSLSLDGLKVQGGTNPLQAHASAKLSLEDAVVLQGKTSGVLATSDAEVSVLRSEILDPRADDAGVGHGLTLTSGAKGTLVDSRVLRAIQAGVFVDAAELDLRRSEVSYTTSKGDTLIGRGVHAQNGAILRLTESLFIANENAAVFGVDLQSFIADGLIIDITGAGVWSPGLDRLIIDITGAGFTDPGRRTGDGIVLVGKPTSRFESVLVDNIVENSKRAAVILDSVEASLDGNLALQNGLLVDGSSLFSQGKSDVSGADEPLVVHLNPSEALALQSAPLAVPTAP